MANHCSQCGKPVLQSVKFCTHCGAALGDKNPQPQAWQRKREKVLGDPRPARRHRTKTLITGALIVLAIGWIYINMPESGNPIIKAQPVVVEPASYPATGQHMYDTPSRLENGKIILPLERLQEKKFVAFMYNAKTTVTPLLAYITGEGKVVTAVSMCEPCNSQRFHVRGEELVCNSCGSTWKLDNLEAISGSCGRFPPDAVPNEVVGNEVRIDEQIVAQWQRRI